MSRCSVEVCSAPAHCRQIGKCGARTSDLDESQLRELCTALGWQGGTYHQVLAEVKRLKAEHERACAIADEAMFELLECECVAQDESRTVLGLSGETQGEVTALADASEAIREAFAWLQPRGYVQLSKDGIGEYIDVLRRPGED